MSRFLLASLASMFVAATASHASAQTPTTRPPSPREALEWMVLNEINSAYFDRAEPMNRPALVVQVPDGVIQEVDISHDGVADWLIDYENSGLMYCGTGGCQRSLYVSVPDDGYVLAFDDQSDTLSITQRRGETVIDMAVHRVLCNPISDECAYSFAWDDTIQRLVERPNVRGETLLTGAFGVLGKPDQDHPKMPDNLPEPLIAQWLATARACPSASSEGEFNAVHADVLSIPDLNGDGERDWYYAAPYPCPAADGTEPAPQPFNIYLSQADGSVVLGFTSQPGESAAYDIATRPAMLVSNPDCGFEGPCRNTRLKWDTRTSRFVPAR